MDSINRGKVTGVVAPFKEAEPECHMEQPKLLDANDFLVKNAPPTIRYIPNFITENEEQMLLNRVYTAPKPKWEYLKDRRLQNWGGLVGKSGLISDGNIPQWLQSLIDKIMSVKNGFPEGNRPNHVLINEYLSGQGIMPHTDGPAFFPLVSTVSLGSSTFLDFYTPLEPGSENPAPISDRFVGSMLLQPRSLVLINSQAYSAHLHGIADRPADPVHDRIFNRPPGLVQNESLPRQTRISLTIRNVPSVKKNSILQMLQKR
ncbi:unnamed protein product [Bursaphelenchus xylophilus]|uniref:(pine wood nematode) hypothetical protein n=1 Tax=Bursaphelenchus xylophilus TaxID=6326 RepID=A0A1I7SBT3_BURXY|nr:unnamed protein product [Bursaphelenchus xylophilus]CAG9113038.1 unnamed protein product [Bursaphelenchus xylophilus]